MKLTSSPLGIRLLKLRKFTLPLLFFLFYIFPNANKQTRNQWSYDKTEVCYKQAQKGLSNETIANAKSDWRAFISRIEDFDYENARNKRSISKGIVYTGHSRIVKKFLQSALMLRYYGCNLPIEFWHFDEISDQEERLIMSTIRNIEVRNLKTIKSKYFNFKKRDGVMYEMKGASLIHSSFDQILFLDADNFVAKDPTFLFRSLPFLETGTLFWKDFGTLGLNNPIWEILDIPCTVEFEQESGQLLIDKTKEKVLLALYLAAFLQQQSELYFHILLGDKDTFRLSWRAVNAPYHMVRPHLGAVGVHRPEIDRFCGHTMVQYSPMWIPSTYGLAPIGWMEPVEAEILFMHANLFKHEKIEQEGKYFHTLKHYKYPEAKKNNGDVFRTKYGLGICTNLRSYEEDSGMMNEAIFEPLEKHLPTFENDYRKIERKIENLVMK